MGARAGFIGLGGMGAPIARRLALFVGREEADIERARPWLEAIGRKLSHLGPVGRGLQVPETAALSVLPASCDVMLARILRAADEAGAAG